MELEYDEVSGKILIDTETFAHMQIEMAHLKARVKLLETSLECIQSQARKVLL